MTDVKKVLTAVDKSTRALTSANDTFAKVVVDLTAQVNTLVAQQIEVAQDIEFKQSELTSLQAQLDTAVRGNAAELRLRVREDEHTVLVELLNGRELAEISLADVRALRAELEQLTRDNTAEVKQAVEAATREVKRNADAELNSVKATHAIEIAQLNANANSDKQTIVLLREQLDNARSDLTAERAARVTTEQARSQAQGVVVNTSGK